EKPKKDPAEDKHGRMYESVLSVLAKPFPQAIPAANGEAAASKDSSDVVVHVEKMTAAKDSVERLILNGNGNSNSHNRCLNLQAASPAATAAKPLKHSVTPSQHDAHSSAPATVEPVAAVASADQGLSANQAISDEVQLRLQQEQHLAVLQAKEE